MTSCVVSSIFKMRQTPAKHITLQYYMHRTFHFRWAQGYNGGKASYIDKDVICYLCGSNVKFIAEDGAETVFRFPGEGIGPFAAHSLSRCFAVAEQCLNPKIYLFVYPTFRQMSVLEGLFLCFIAA